MKRYWLTAVVAVVALTLGSSRAKASLDTAFSGNTQPVTSHPGGGEKGFIDFAVYTYQGGTADPYGAGISAATLTTAGFHVGAAYLYLFQIVDTDTDVSQSTVNWSSGAVSGQGILTGAGFMGVTASNPTDSNTKATPSNSGNSFTSPAATGQTWTITTGQAGLVSPTSLTPGTFSLQASFNTNLSAAHGQVSSLWGYTSAQAPSLTSGSMQDMGTSGNGTVPGNIPSIASVPEPSTLALAGLGALGLIGYGLRRRRALGA
jgi:hypothetical protein